jgi:uncharacterized protein (TIGR04255 family)
MPSDMTLDSLCYKRNFLTEVIARIDLVSPLSCLEKEITKDIRKKALGRFPIEEPKQAFAHEIILSEKESATKKQPYTEWNYFGPNREKQLTIIPPAFFVAYKKYYDKYEELRDDFIAISNAFFQSYEQSQPSRLGLRYINELTLPGDNPLNWQEYVNNNLLGMFSYTIDDAAPSRIFHNYEVVFKNFNLRFQFGLHNPDYPAPIRRRVFILDYDAYFKGAIEPKDIPDCLDQFHSTIQGLFEKCITGKLREVMNGNA